MSYVCSTGDHDLTIAFLGSGRAINIVLKSYDPATVICLPDRSPEPPPSGCVEVFDNMPKGQGQRVYAEDPDPQLAQVAVPVIELNRASNQMSLYEGR